MASRRLGIKMSGCPGNLRTFLSTRRRPPSISRTQACRAASGDVPQLLMRDIISLRFAVVKMSARAPLAFQGLEFQFYCFLINSGRRQIGGGVGWQCDVVDRGCELPSSLKSTYLPCGNFGSHIVPSERERTWLVSVCEKCSAEALLDSAVDWCWADEEKPSGAESFAAKYVAFIDNLRQDALGDVLPVHPGIAESLERLAA